MGAKSVEALLNKCGLLAVSKVSADTRELEKRLSDKSVELAVNMLSYRVRKYVGAYLAALAEPNRLWLAEASVRIRLSCEKGCSGSLIGVVRFSTWNKIAM